jgi:hypothetical protein
VPLNDHASKPRPRARPKLIAASLAALALSAAGCASSTPSSATSASPVTIYRTVLTGTAENPPGAPNGTGDAIIAFHGSSLVCWRFAHLHGFTNATVAHINTGATGKSGSVAVPLSTGPRLHHQGCVPITPTLAKTIEHNPPDYYVNIHSTQYPGGAVRGQL